MVDGLATPANPVSAKGSRSLRAPYALKSQREGTRLMPSDGKLLPRASNEDWMDSGVTTAATQNYVDS